jgi:hypothetical protein
MSDEQPNRGAGSRSAWWRLVEAEVERRQAIENDLDDPWGDAPPATEALTEAQRERLAGLDDQPAVPRLAGTTADGDDDDQPPPSRYEADDDGDDGAD